MYKQVKRKGREHCTVEILARNTGSRPDREQREGKERHEGSCRQGNHLGHPQSCHQYAHGGTAINFGIAFFHLHKEQDDRDENAYGERTERNTAQGCYGHEEGSVLLGGDFDILAHLLGGNGQGSHTRLTRQGGEQFRIRLHADVCHTYRTSFIRKCWVRFDCRWWAQLQRKRKCAARKCGQCKTKNCERKFGDDCEDLLWWPPQPGAAQDKAMRNAKAWVSECAPHKL